MPDDQPETTARHNPAHLKFIRSLPCLACGKFPPSQAAHIRCGTDGGIGLKPSDRYVVPLCDACHAAQHQLGERSFWAAVDIDPLPYASALWAYPEHEKVRLAAWSRNSRLLTGS